MWSKTILMENTGGTGNYRDCGGSAALLPRPRPGCFCTRFYVRRTRRSNAMGENSNFNMPTFLPVVLSTWGKDVDDQRLGQGRCLVFNSSTNNETVSRVSVESGFANRDS